MATVLARSCTSLPARRSGRGWTPAPAVPAADRASKRVDEHAVGGEQVGVEGADEWAGLAAALTVRAARAHLPFSLTWWSSGRGELEQETSLVAAPLVEAHCPLDAPERELPHVQAAGSRFQRRQQLAP